MTALPSSSYTPEGVLIKARNMSFEIEQALATDWADKDAFLTAIFNAMSISFPSGEKNFIDSVRVYQDRIEDPKLRSEVKGFFKQEGIHSREHRKYNQLLCQRRGYDLEELEGVYLKRIEASKNDPKITNRVMLASTVAVEHFTASFGESFLQGKLVKNVEGPLGDLWRWHSLEELEHKSVAFDVYRQIGGDNKMRTTVMRLSMMTLFWDVMKVAIKILLHDQQLWKWKTVKSMAKFLFSKQGFIRIHVPAYKAFFRDDFHPWDIDNRPLLEHWQEKLAPVMAAA